MLFPLQTQKGKEEGQGQRKGARASQWQRLQSRRSRGTTLQQQEEEEQRQRSGEEVRRSQRRRQGWCPIWQPEAVRRPRLRVLIALWQTATCCDCACHEPVSLWQITRDYDEEEQGYGSEKEREARKDSDDSALSPQSVEGNGTARPAKAKVNGADDRHEEDMDVSD